VPYNNPQGQCLRHSRISAP